MRMQTSPHLVREEGSWKRTEDTHLLLAGYHSPTPARRVFFNSITKQRSVKMAGRCFFHSSMNEVPGKYKSRCRNAFCSGLSCFIFSSDGVLP